MLKKLLEILGFRKEGVRTHRDEGKPEARKVDFYYSNLVNALILFASTPEYLESLDGPIFNALFELETEIDYVYMSVLFNELFTLGLVDEFLRPELESFKTKVDNTSNDLWTWDAIYSNPHWQDLRSDANGLLNKLGVETRIYSEDFTTTIGSDGRILKDSKFKVI
jgi:hypothetical protein